MLLTLLTPPHSVCRLAPDAQIPDLRIPLEQAADCIVSITRTADELSIVCPAGHEPEPAVISRGWRVLRVAGPLDLTLTGVMAGLAVPLRDGGIPLFALATYDTDYLMIQDTDLARAVVALEASGHEVEGS